jgi:hypothetical protein
MHYQHKQLDHLDEHDVCECTRCGATVTRFDLLKGDRASLRFQWQAKRRP